MEREKEIQRGGMRERRERAETEERRERLNIGESIERRYIIFLKLINRPRMEKKICKRKLHIVGRKGKLKLSQQYTL